MKKWLMIGTALAAAAPGTANATGQDAAAAPAGLAFEPPEGPWRQLIRYQPREGRESGISLWVNEGALLAEDIEPPVSTRTPREAHELWINHGTARVAGQSYRIRHVRHYCGEGPMTVLGEAAFSEYGLRLATVAGDGERIPVLPHSAESAARQAVCGPGSGALDGATAEAVGDALIADPAGPAPAEPSDSLTVDLDADGEPERLRVEMRPHSMRLDIHLIPGRDPTRPFNIIAVEQPPTGPLVQSRLRPVPPNTYLYACEREENRDREPCQAGVATVVRGGVEVVTPGQPSLLLWLPDREPRIVRLPETPPPLPPMPISHHDRPATPAIGTYYVGRIGEACGGGRLADGRAYGEEVRAMEAGQRFGVSLTSPDSPLTLQVFRQGQPERPLATVAAQGDGQRTSTAFTVAETGDHVLRVIGPDGEADGRWRVELSFERSIDSVYFSDWFDWNLAEAACR